MVFPTPCPDLTDTFLWSTNAFMISLCLLQRGTGSPGFQLLGGLSLGQDSIEIPNSSLQNKRGFSLYLFIKSISFSTGLLAFCLWISLRRIGNGMGKSIKLINSGSTEGSSINGFISSLRKMGLRVRL